MLNNRVYLKMKMKSLAAEARIIKAEERKQKRLKHHSTLQGLQHHRQWEVRREARVSHLASGFIRGRAWEKIEDANHTLLQPDWTRVRRLVEKYGVRLPTVNDGYTYEDFKLAQHEQMVRYEAWEEHAQRAIRANQRRRALGDITRALAAASA